MGPHQFLIQSHSCCCFDNSVIPWGILFQNLKLRIIYLASQPEVWITGNPWFHGWEARRQHSIFGWSVSSRHTQIRLLRNFNTENQLVGRATGCLAASKATLTFTTWLLGRMPRFCALSSSPPSSMTLPFTLTRSHHKNVSSHILLFLKTALILFKYFSFSRKLLYIINVPGTEICPLVYVIALLYGELNQQEESNVF